MKLADLDVQIQYFINYESYTVDHVYTKFNKNDHHSLKEYIVLQTKGGNINATYEGPIFRFYDYNINKKVIHRDDTYYLKCSFCPSFTVSDELKRFLIENRMVYQSRELYTVKFGHYLDGDTKDEASQIEWFLDVKGNKLRIKYPIYGEVPIYKGYKKRNNIYFKESALHDYIKNDLFFDIFRYEDKIQKPAIKPSCKPEELIEEVPNTENKLQTEVDNIRYIIPNDVNHIVFSSRLEKLINDYNTNLERYVESVDNELLFGVVDEETASKQLLLNLNLLKEDILEYTGNTQVYNELLRYINDIEAIITTKYCSSSDEFLLYLMEIFRGPISYLGTNKYDELLLEELCRKPKKIINNHMKQLLSFGETTDIPYKNKDELIFELRKQLHPILIDIANDVRLQSEEKRKQIQIDYSKELINIAHKQYYSHIGALLLEEINNAYSETERLLTLHGIDIDKINSIYAEPITCDTESEEYVNALFDKYKRIIEIYYEVNNGKVFKNNIMNKRLV